MIVGANFYAAKNTFLIIFSDSPTYLFNIEEAERVIKVQPDSLAKALQIKVLPFPGGPYRRRTLGGALIPWYKSGLFRGRITASSKTPFTSLRPTISAKVTSIFLTIKSLTSGYTTGSVYFFWPLFCQGFS